MSNLLAEVTKSIADGINAILSEIDSAEQGKAEKATLTDAEIEPEIGTDIQADVVPENDKSDSTNAPVAVVVRRSLRKLATGRTKVRVSFSSASGRSDTDDSSGESSPTPSQDRPKLSKSMLEKLRTYPSIKAHAYFQDGCRVQVPPDATLYTAGLEINIFIF